jgi:hypothetical protein
MWIAQLLHEIVLHRGRHLFQDLRLVEQHLGLPNLRKIGDDLLLLRLAEALLL